MFVLVTSEGADRAAPLLEQFGALLAPGNTIERLPLGDLTLLFWSTRAGDVLVAPPGAEGETGRTVFVGWSPTSEGSPSARAAHPLATGVLVDSEPELRVTPVGVRNVYRDGDALSDSSLLLAALGDRSVAPLHVAALATVGYVPGRLTLFGEVRRLAFRSGLRRRRGQWESVELGWPAPAVSDGDMIDQMTAALAGGQPAALGLTTGYDSRLALGLLQRAGRPVRCVHKVGSGEDEGLLRAVADAAGVELSFVENTSTAQIAPLVHAAAADAGIYLIHDALATLSLAVPAGQEVHVGQFADCTVKNAYVAAYNHHPLGVDVARSIVQRYLLRGSDMVRAIGIEPGDVEQLLYDELSELLRGIDLRGNKAKAAYLYYVSRGLRWSDAQHGGLALTNPVVAGLSHLPGSLWGFSTSTWDNFAYDRVRRINHDHGFDLGLPYGDGGPPVPRRALTRPLHKVQYEYLARFRKQRTIQAGRRADSAPLDSYITDVERSTFASVFPGRDLDDLLASGTHRSMKRAAVTAAQATRLAGLQFDPSRPAEG